MILTPFAYEIFQVVSLAALGISFSVIVGIKDPILGASAGFAAALLINLFVTVGFQATQIDPHLFLRFLTLGLLVLGILRGRTHWKQVLWMFGTFASVGLLALLLKYILLLGEIQHSDSSDIIAQAVLVVQPGTEEIFREGDTGKRGLLLPVSLSLGPLGRILGVLIPMSFLFTWITSFWIAWKLSPKLSNKAKFASFALVAFFLGSIPIFRISMTYINSHILVSLGLVLISCGWVLNRHHPDHTRDTFWLFTLGGLLATTSRVEGIAIVSLYLIVIANSGSSESPIRSRILISSALNVGAFLIWQQLMGHPLANQLGLPNWLLFGLALIPALATSIKFHKNTNLTVGIAISLITIWAIWDTAAASGEPSKALEGLIGNLFLGIGGWGTAIPAGILLILLGPSMSRDFMFRSFAAVSGLTVQIMILSKIIDGGLGRAGFYDSLNRMLLHVLPLIAISVFGYLAAAIDRAEIFDRFKRPQRPTSL